jgi:hypothetical protein
MPSSWRKRRPSPPATRSCRSPTPLPWRWCSPPLALLPYRLAYAVSALAMVAATWVAVNGLIRLMPRLAPWRGIALLGALAFPPLFRATTQGQNMALVLCLLVWTIVAVKEERPVLAGTLLGLLWFKATYAAPLTGLPLLNRRFRVVATTAATIAIGWVISTAMVGPSWLPR